MSDAIYRALCACFGLLPSSLQASVLIREAYQEPENAPRLPRNTDVIYYSFAPDPAAAEAPPAYDAEAFAQSSQMPVVSAFSAWTLTAVCYGPHALINARKIRAFLFVDGAGFPRSILRKAGIRPVPDPPEPMLLHEPEGSLWRKRADLTISLRAEERQVYSSPGNVIAVPPAVMVHTEN